MRFSLAYRIFVVQSDCLNHILSYSNGRAVPNLLATLEIADRELGIASRIRELREIWPATYNVVSVNTRLCRVLVMAEQNHRTERGEAKEAQAVDEVDEAEEGRADAVRDETNEDGQRGEPGDQAGGLT
jgi:hypothetical protein